MTSTIHADKIMNSSGDQDSGLDLLVNDTLVAQGEVVLVNERYGVRLTQVIPAAERVKNL